MENTATKPENVPLGPFYKLRDADDLINYCLRNLGAPVLNIEVEEQQCYDRVTEAISMYIQRHYDGTTEVWEPYKMTAEDVSAGELTLDNKWIAVLDILDPLGSNANTGDQFDNLNFAIANSDFFNFNMYTSSDMVTNWFIFKQKIDLIKRFFSPQKKITFNSITHKLWFTDQRSLMEHYPIVIHGYKNIDPIENFDVFNDEWVKKYTTALIGMQWGKNLTKFNGIEMPGGTTLNGEQIYSMWKEYADQYYQELLDRYEPPMAFFFE